MPLQQQKLRRLHWRQGQKREARVIAELQEVEVLEKAQASIEKLDRRRYEHFTSHKEEETCVNSWLHQALTDLYKKTLPLTFLF